tara:strand:- start:509 stop:706 length:198 start_codon:yes stop_codon:yes gene_type:complete
VIKYFFLICLFVLISCGYPDIDTVPSFEKMNISLQESIELCKIKNSVNNQEAKCFEYLNLIYERL